MKKTSAAAALLIATSTLTVGAAPSASAATYADVTSIEFAETYAVGGFDGLEVAIDLDTDNLDDISKVEGRLVVDGVDLGYQRFSVSNDDYSKATFYWDSEVFGVGEAQILDTRITYYGESGPAQVIDDETGSNPFLVQQESSVSGSVAHYTDGSLLIQARGTYFSAEKDETVDLAGAKVTVYRFIGKTPKKILTLTLNKEGEAEKRLTKQGMKKYKYAIAYAGTKEIAPAAVQTSGKV